MNFLINVLDANPITGEKTQVKFITDIFKETGRVTAIGGDLFLYEVSLQKLFGGSLLNYIPINGLRMTSILQSFQPLLGIYGPIICLPEDRNRSAFSVVENMHADSVAVSKMYDTYIEYYEKCPWAHPEVAYPNEVFVNGLKNNRPMIVTSVPDGIYK